MHFNHSKSWGITLMIVVALINERVIAKLSDVTVVFFQFVCADWST